MSFFFFNDTATTEIYTLSLHDALPIYERRRSTIASKSSSLASRVAIAHSRDSVRRNNAEVLILSGSSSLRLLTYRRSEEHTSELQSRQYLVCRLLLEKKNVNSYTPYTV